MPEKKNSGDNTSPGKVARGKSSQSPMAENVGEIDRNHAGTDTEIQNVSNDEPVKPASQRAADINGVEYEAEQ